MSNVIDLNSFRKRKTESVTVTTPQLEPVQSVTPLMAMVGPMKPAKVEEQFHRDATRFRFIRMKPPGAFVVMNTNKLPNPFPPDPLPPLVA